MTMIAALLLTLSPVAAQAQPTTVTAAAIDPARLAAATELLDVLMPPATREQMMTGMMAPMLANVRRGVSENPSFAAAMNGDPKLKAMFDRFMAQQQARTTDMMRRSLPGMIPAMVRAYARRFDVQQLREIRAFFETPTGRAYMQTSFTIMSDPDIAAWQRQMMQEAMSHVLEDVASFAREAAALEKTP